MLLEEISLIHGPPLDSCRLSNPEKTKQKKAIKIMQKVKNGE